MAHVVIMGAGIGGLPAAFEMREALRKEDRITVVSNTPTFHFVPSNPWVAVNWRKRRELVRSASIWIDRHGRVGESYRFDVIGVILDERGVRVRHVENAFGVSSRA